MPDPRYLLTGDDLRAIRALREAQATEVQNTFGNAEGDEVINNAPEVYVGYPQCGTGNPFVGIPARVGDKPGQALCCIFKVSEPLDGSDPVLVPVMSGDNMLRQVVYNIYTTNVPMTYTKLVRTKYGTWLSDKPDDADPTTTTSTTTTPGDPGTTSTTTTPNMACAGQCQWIADDNLKWLPPDSSKCTAPTTTSTSSTSTSTTTTPGCTGTCSAGVGSCSTNCGCPDSGDGACVPTTTTTTCGLCPPASTTSTTTTTGDGSTTTSTSTSSSSSTSTSTTTTSANPSGCGCIAPTFCPTSPGQCTYTTCSKGELYQDPPLVCNTTTTTACTGTCSAGTGNCSPNCECPSGGNGPCVVTTTTTCQCIGTTTTGQCGTCTVIGNPLGGVVIQDQCCGGQFCVVDTIPGPCVTGTAHCASQGPAIPVPCTGMCSFYWLGGGINTFQFNGGNCSGGIVITTGGGVNIGCGCETPVPLDPSVCFAPVTTPCISPTTTTPGLPPPCSVQCTTSTSTTTTPNCANTGCTYNVIVLSQTWNQAVSNCKPGCICTVPPGAPQQDCQLVHTPCQPTSSTTSSTTSSSTTTSSTSTTTTPCSGACAVECAHIGGFGDGDPMAYQWVQSGANVCHTGCLCDLANTPCDPSLESTSNEGGCVKTTTTSTSSSTTTTTSTTTTNPACDGSCGYICLGADGDIAPPFTYHYAGDNCSTGCVCPPGGGCTDGDPPINVSCVSTTTTGNCTSGSCGMICQDAGFGPLWYPNSPPDDCGFATGMCSCNTGDVCNTENEGHTTVGTCVPNPTTTTPGG